MSHLTLQEVIERINNNQYSGKGERVNNDRAERQPRRPELYILRTTKRIAEFVFKRLTGNRIGVIRHLRPQFSSILCEERMKMKINKLVLWIILVSFGTSLGFAKSKPDVRDVTGCLSKGDTANQFLLTGSDGSTWELKSSKVALADHVGHTVTATGVVSNATMHNMKEDAKEVAKDSGMTKGDAEHGHLTVTEVKMVSDSCK